MERATVTIVVGSVHLDVCALDKYIYFLKEDQQDPYFVIFLICSICIPIAKLCGPVLLLTGGGIVYNKWIENKLFSSAQSVFQDHQWILKTANSTDP